MTWKDAFKELPEKEGEYLTERMDRNTSNVWYEICQFEPQNEYETRYSKEFKQDVRVMVKSTEPKFRDTSSFVIRWMEIPK